MKEVFQVGYFPCESISFMDLVVLQLFQDPVENVRLAAIDAAAAISAKDDARPTLF